MSSSLRSPQDRYALRASLNPSYFLLMETLPTTMMKISLQRSHMQRTHPWGEREGIIYRLPEPMCRCWGIQDHDVAITALGAPDDGLRISSGADNGSIRLWDLDPGDWVETACLSAGRNLTQEESNIYLPSKAYAPTCPQYPSNIEP